MDGVPLPGRDGSSPAVKICCIASRAEAALAVAHGAGAVGLVSAMPSGPGPIAESTIAEIVPSVPPGVRTFLLTASTRTDEIVAQQARTGVDTIQLVDRLSAATLETLRARLPSIGLVQVIHVRGADSVREATEVAPLVDMLLLDSGNPDLPIKELGGTGRTHDWNISREIVERIDVPVFLAGGLAPGNVRAAIEAVAPFGVDLCSGVRVDGALDEDLLGQFMTEVRGTRVGASG